MRNKRMLTLRLFIHVILLAVLIGVVFTITRHRYTSPFLDILGILTALSFLLNAYQIDALLKIKQETQEILEVESSEKEKTFGNVQRVQLFLLRLWLVIASVFYGLIALFALFIIFALPYTVFYLGYVIVFIFTGMRIRIDQFFDLDFKFRNFNRKFTNFTNKLFLIQETHDKANKLVILYIFSRKNKPRN